MKILFKNNTKYTKEKYNDFIEFHKNKYGKKMIIKFVITVICVLYILIFNIINKNWLVILLLTGIAIMVYLLNNVISLVKYYLNYLKRQKTIQKFF